MRRFVYNNTLKPSETRMPVFIPPTGGEVSGKWRRKVVLVRVKELQMYSSGYAMQGEYALELDRGLCYASEGSEGIWYRGQFGH